jgi:hypothetical protein
MAKKNDNKGASRKDSGAEKTGKDVKSSTAPAGKGRK